MLKSQGRAQIQREQAELKEFLIREKHKGRVIKRMEEKFRKVEDKKRERLEEIREVRKAKEEKRA